MSLRSDVLFNGFVFVDRELAFLDKDFPNYWLSKTIFVYNTKQTNDSGPIPSLSRIPLSVK